MKNPKIIAFTGSMGTGKSTAIEVLKEISKENIILIKFAQPLYDIQELIYDRIKTVYKRPKNFVKDRLLLQLIGTDWGRDNISKSMWSDIWQAEMELEVLVGNLVVCDDCRFDNEAERIKNLGGAVIKLTSNKSHERIDITSGIVNHASEAGVDENFVDYKIANDGTLEEFKEKLLKVYKKLLDDSK